MRDRITGRFVSKPYADKMASKKEFTPLRQAYATIGFGVVVLALAVMFIRGVEFLIK